MTRKFSIHYNTAYGEELRLLRKSTPEGDYEVCTMQYTADGIHTLDDTKGAPMWYRYELQTLDGTICERHDRYVGLSVCDTSVMDTWRSPEMASDTLRAEAFARAVFPCPEGLTSAPMPTKGRLVIALSEPRIEEGEAFCIVGKQFINWNTDKAMVMTRYDNAQWQIEIDKNPILKELEFKFGIVDTQTGAFKRYENGENHVIAVDTNASAQMVCFNGFDYGSLWKAAGVAVPVFSLRTTKSRGCGEFLDLIALANWCVEAKMRVIQLLPINDTTATFAWRDSYPYNAISTMALHPNYISVQDVYDYYERSIKSMEREDGLYLNDINFSDYNRTREWKCRNLRSLFDEARNKVMADEAFEQYMKDNAWWIRDYTVFATLRNEYGTPDFRQWPEEATYSEAYVDGCFAPQSAMYDEVVFRAFIQFHLERQLNDALAYAHSKNIAIKGDLPIGINPNSVEAWVNPELFNFGLQAGAPPDFFSRDGQNWGFPIYNWDVMARDGFGWWQRRLGRMQQFFDAFRIDHILGFFRIWSIPKPFKSGLMGIFSPALPYSAQEIASKGFSIDAADCAIPVATRSFISAQLGEVADIAIRDLFTHTGFGEQYRLKREYFGPDKISDWVEENVPITVRDRIRTGFNNIFHEVLFVSVKDGEYHPRIMLTETERYRMLSAQNQHVIRALHDDFFFARHNEFWKQMAEKHLGGMLKNCKMLVCGEDLGMIPDSVPVIMQRMQILALELQRMPKLNWERYGNCAAYQYMSVCATSSHDISNIRGWWEENTKETQWYYNNVLKRDGMAPAVAQEGIVSEIVSMHLGSPSMLCINPIQDYAGMVDNMPHLLPNEERINQPADSNNLWRYRVPFCIDELVTKYPELHKRVRAAVERSGR